MVNIIRFQAVYPKFIQTSIGDGDNGIGCITLTCVTLLGESYVRFNIRGNELPKLRCTSYELLLRRNS